MPGTGSREACSSLAQQGVAKGAGKEGGGRSRQREGRERTGPGVAYPVEVGEDRT